MIDESQPCSDEISVVIINNASLDSEESLTKLPDNVGNVISLKETIYKTM